LLREWLAHHHVGASRRVQVYWHRALFITVISSLASYSWRPRERKEYPEEVRAPGPVCWWVRHGGA
jgi:hypothetical protein